MQIGRISLAHKDERRTISEWNGVDRSVQWFTFHQSNNLTGKHYHVKKEETFIITEGAGTVLLCRINEAGQAVEKVQHVVLESGSVIVIPPFVAHTFYLQSGTIKICLSSAPFDPDDMDMCPAEWLVR